MSSDFSSLMQASIAYYYYSGFKINLDSADILTKIHAASCLIEFETSIYNNMIIFSIKS